MRSGQNIGKDAVTAAIILWFMECMDYPRIPCTAPTARQLYTVLWPELSKWMRKGNEVSRQRGDHPRFYLDRLFTHTHDLLYDKAAPQNWFAVARTAYVLRQGPLIPHIEAEAKTEPMAIVGQAVQLIREHAIDEVFVDTIGIGAGVYSRLCELR